MWYIDVYQIISLCGAIVLGGLIGLEREINGKPAGLRTNILICMGSAAFTMMSYELGGAEAGTRMIAGVITGVGFLGAGALIQEGKGIHGLTTAASIWLVTSIGIACGSGWFLFAIIETALALIVLWGLAPLTRWIDKKFGKEKTP